MSTGDRYLDKILAKRETIKSPSEASGLMNPYSVVNSDDYGIFNQREYQHDLQEAQYAAELQMMQYQNEYNSPEAQANRQREAGINPDLAGVSGEQAAGMQGTASPANITAETGLEKALGLTSTIVSVMSGLMDGALGASHKLAEIDRTTLDNFQRAAGLAKPIGDALGGVYGESLAEEPEVQDFALENYLRKIPKRYRGSLRAFAKDYMQTPEFRRNVYAQDTATAKARGENAEISVDPRYNGDFSELQAALKPLKEAEFELAKELLKGEKSKAEKMSSYWMNRDMGASAEKENAQDKSEKGQAEIMEIIRAGALKSVRKLEKAMDDGKWWASTALSAIYASLMGLSPSLPSVSHSTQSSHRENQYGTIENAQSSWNFGF